MKLILMSIAVTLVSFTASAASLSNMGLDDPHIAEPSGGGWGGFTNDRSGAGSDDDGFREGCGVTGNCHTFKPKPKKPTWATPAELLPALSICWINCEPDTPTVIETENPLPSTVPVPASLWLLLVGLSALVLPARRA